MIDEAIAKAEAAIRQVTGIRDLQIEPLRDMFTYKRIAKNDFFLKAGDDSKIAGFVVSGAFRYYYLDREGHEHTKNFALENNTVISYGAFLRNQPSMMYVQALEASEVLLYDFSHLRALAANDMGWLKMLLRITETSYLEKESRESELLFYDAQTRYLNFCRDFPDLERRLKQYHIASYLGIAPEVLSRIRANLKN
ncbi:MAG: Crp/Fnr family transcriptional regulator [Acidobacteriota bacterium]|jgi:CRP-like cAMP-binding protein|nr:Crp/Fnr family transcriptional regulator [Acidobacteriota bacterium]